MKGREFRFMSWDGTAPRRAALGGQSWEGVLQKAVYERKKHVGRFPKRHVPGVGYHSVLRVRNKGDNVERGLDRQGIERSMNDERCGTRGTHFTAPIVMLC